MSDAALAYENCDRSYRPKFAEPKPVVPRFSGNDSHDQSSHQSSSYDDRGRHSFIMNPLSKMAGNVSGKLLGVGINLRGAGGIG